MSKKQKKNKKESKEMPETFAVIDIGTGSIRLEIAEYTDDRKVQILDSLQQTVSIGKDTFTESIINNDTIELCVSVLKSFSYLLHEYNITSPEQIKTIATSAVREAKNKQAFIDRVYIATGIEIKTIDEAEVNRFSYLAIDKSLHNAPITKNKENIIIEVGSGSTDILIVENRVVKYSHGFPLGAMRIRHSKELHNSNFEDLKQFLNQRIKRTLSHLDLEYKTTKDPNIVIMGGDARFAALYLCPEWDKIAIQEISTEKLHKMAEEILKYSVDELVQIHHLSYPDAETLGPALLSYACIAEHFGCESCLVSPANMRDGVLMEMASHNEWTLNYTKQICDSALVLGNRYQFEKKHALHVADSCDLLFKYFQNSYRLSGHSRLLLKLSAYLHEIGLFVSSRNHHKHSMYLIQNSSLFGIGVKDLDIIAMIARYHRKSPPMDSHPYYISLDRKSRILVSKLSALIRVADCIDSAHDQALKIVSINEKEDMFEIQVKGKSDITLEKAALRGKRDLFEQIYGKRITIRNQGADF